jgi:hypothetical protein
MEQVKAEEVVLKDTIEDQKYTDKASNALVRSGETSSSATSMEMRKVTKTIRAPMLCISHPNLIGR